MEKNLNNNPQTSTPTDKEVKERLKEEIKNEKFKPYWTWYIFLICNVLVVLGAAITWILFDNNMNNPYWVSTLVCNIVSLGCFIVFAIFETKDIQYKKFHTAKKWSYFIIASVIIYGIIIILTSILSSITVVVNNNNQPITLICSFAISAAISLACIGLYRYGRFHIDKDIFARKHGVVVKEQLEAEKTHELDRQKVEHMSDEEFKKYRDEIDTTPDHEKIGQEATSGISHEKFDD